MSNKKHIDRIFQESFKDFEAKPNPDLWSKIQNDIALKTEKPKTAFPIWIRVASVAAVLAVLITIGSFVFTDTNNPVSSDDKIVDTQSQSDADLSNSDKTNTNSKDNSATKNTFDTTNSSIYKTASNKEASAFENETIVNNDLDVNGNPIVGENSEIDSNLNSGTQNNTKVISNATSKANRAVANAENTNNKRNSNSNSTNTSNKITNSNSKNGIASQDNKGTANPSNNTDNAISNSAVESANNVAENTSENGINSDENSESQSRVASNKSVNIALSTDKKNAIAANESPEEGLNSVKNSTNQTGIASNKSTNKASSTDSKTNKKEAIAANETSEKTINKSILQNKDNNNNTVASTINSDNERSKTASDVQRAVSSSETPNLLKERSPQNAIAWNAKSSNTPQNEKEKEENLMVGDSLVSESPSIEEAIALAEDITEKDEDEKLVNRWQVQANIAPVYYNSLGKGSHIDDEFVSNSKSGETNTSYGVNVSYAISKKIAIRSGISSLNLSYDTDNVILYNSPSTNTTNPLRNIDLAPGNQTLNAFSGDNLGFQQINNELFNAAISQRLSYYEVPMELEYKLVNNRFGVNIIGGMSTFFLNDNEVYSEFEEFKTYIGEANNVNSVSFSTNLGIGLNYKFTEKLLFNFEPTFKYQLNGFDNTSGDFRPYIIGVYTGFSYKF